MKLRVALPLIGLGMSIAAFASVQGCGSDSSDGDGADQTGKTVPAEEGSPTTATEERTFAVNSLLLGEADRAGNKNANAWKAYGYNLDDRITNVVDQRSADLSRVCKRVQGAPATVHQDGDQGIDNAFGKEILKLLEPFTPTPSRTISDAITAGEFTIMLKVVGLTDEPEQTNTNLSGTLLVGGAFDEDPTKLPTFTVADDWPYLQEPQVGISGAYINKGIFVNGKGGATVKLSLSIGGQALDLSIHKALITFKHAPDKNALEEGTIAGVIDTEEFVSGIASIAGRFDPSLCEGLTVESIKDSIRQASDMIVNGAQDPEKTCDGISVGIGFTAMRIGTPTKVASPADAPPDPCDPNAAPQDAGTDSGS